MKVTRKFTAFCMLMLGALAFYGCGGSGGSGGGGGLILATFDSADTPGDAVLITAGSMTVYVIYANSSSTDIIFPMGEYDNSTGTISHRFFLSQTEVTYGLWYEVYQWAVHGTGGAIGEGQYTFANPGREGHDGTDGALPTSAKNEPVTMIYWCDTVVWCNAFTEWYNAQNGTSYTCVYTYSGAIIRDSINSGNCTSAVVDYTAKGFRLPASAEWEFAARYIGTDAGGRMYLVSLTGNNPNNLAITDGYYWTPGGYASGATADYNDNTANGRVAVYLVNSGSSTAVVKSKAANALGLYDMSGNVWEYCFDSYDNTSDRVARGGAWDLPVDDGYYLKIGLESRIRPTNDASYKIGFRFARTQ